MNHVGDDPHANQQAPETVGATGSTGVAARIAGLSSLKGLVVYGAVLTFAGFYAYFMEEIASSPSGSKPDLDVVMVSAAAALAGVLGSAFALVIGAPTTVTNEGLAKQIKETTTRLGGFKLLLRRIFSLEPAGTTSASLPLTFGVWVYALIAAAVAVVYFLDQAETPDAIKALATVFAGYVVALMTAAYGLATKAS